MTRRQLAATRVVLALLTLTAVAFQFVRSTNAGADPVNFFSYFTILSNVFVSGVFLTGALYLAENRLPTPFEDAVRGASVLYMLVTGIVYSTLLSQYELGLTLPWVNVQLHYVMPIAVVLDWLYRPQLSKLTLRRARWWLLFPLAYLAYSLVRGRIAFWYPYPFLDPHRPGGYGSVALFSLGLLAAMATGGALIMMLGNRLRRNGV